MLNQTSYLLSTAKKRRTRRRSLGEASRLGASEAGAEEDLSEAEEEEDEEEADLSAE